MKVKEKSGECGVRLLIHPENELKRHRPIKERESRPQSNLNVAEGRKDTEKRLAEWAQPRHRREELRGGGSRRKRESKSADVSGETFPLRHTRLRSLGENEPPEVDGTISRGGSDSMSEGRRTCNANQPVGKGMSETFWGQFLVKQDKRIAT